MIKKMNILKNKKGMTLIETVVAFAIVAVISVVIIMGFRTMGTVLNEGSKMDRLDQQLEKDIAMSAPTSEPAIDASIKLSGGSIVIDGTIKEYYVDKGNGAKQSFRIFEADK